MGVCMAVGASCVHVYSYRHQAGNRHVHGLRGRIPLDRCSEDTESQAWRDLRVPGEKSTEAGSLQGAGQEVGGETTLDLPEPGEQ